MQISIAVERLAANITTQNKFLPHRINLLDYYAQICMEGIFFWNSTDITPTKSESIYDTIKRMVPEINSTIKRSMFKGQFVQFHPIFTDHGLCYTFNSLNSQDIYTDKYGRNIKQLFSSS